MQLAAKPHDETAPTKAHSNPDEQPGAVIGPYKLLERIGEGGMAAVYMAEQEKPLRRRVALKITKLGMDTKQVVARFEVERQALALMDHPNIAHVFDAGATETGRPYFVMELVRGISFTEYCNRNRLTTRERLDLFVPVCKAVHHAHQKGIIHRDLKPSNIMVTLHDGVPVPKVIDFGIAKATDQRLTEKTVFTRYAEMIGTPEYMSPEQAEMSGMDIDTRTDIYSLGVVLYELLTGALPFDTQSLRAAPYDELRRIIREEEPIPPSTRVSTLGEEAQTIAANRRTDVAALTRCLRSELGWIPLKALRKDRTRRYHSVHALGDDILNYLNDIPLIAGPESAAYRISKFLNRYRRTLIATASVVVITVIGLVFGVSMYGQARKAERQREAAQEMAQRSEALNMLSRAQDLVSRAAYAQALSHVEPILESPYVGAQARLLRARCRLMTQAPVDETIQALEGLLNEEAQVAGAAHGLLAQIYLASDLKDDEKVAKINHHQQQAEALLPETAEAYFLRAMTTDAVQQTLELLNRAVTLDRGHYAAIKARALAHYALHDWRHMERDAAAMMSLRQHDPLGYALLATALRETQQVGEALDYHHKAIALSAENPELYDQRRETYLVLGDHEAALADARQCVALLPDEEDYLFDVFCDLTTLGRLEEARTIYNTRFATDLQVREAFYRQSARYIARTLGNGGHWHAPGIQPQGAAFLGMIESDENYRYLSAKAQRIAAGFHISWAPDGETLTFSQGVLGFSGVASFNLDSGKKTLLTTPGKDAMVSPDGQNIAYIRPLEILPLAHFSGDYGIQRAQKTSEVWVMNVDGTAPRRLVEGHYPSWGGDSRRVFYAGPGRAFSSVSLDDPADCRQVCRFRGRFPVVSPDGKYLAEPSTHHLEILELATGATVARWIVPNTMRGKYVNWSPDGRQLYLGNDQGSMGLWCFDLDTGESKKLYSGTILKAQYSSNGHLALTSAYPRGIWVVRDPDMGAHQTTEAHHWEVINWTTRRIEANYLEEDSRLRRAEAYLELKEMTPARTDLEWLSQHGQGSLMLASRFNALAWHLVAGPHAIRDIDMAWWLVQQATSLQPLDPDIRTTRGVIHYRRGQYQQALTILQTSYRKHQMQSPGRIPRDLAFMAMAQHRLGHRQEARAALTRLQELMKNGHYRGDFEGWGLLREAQTLMGRQ